jgi:hypothetical protein
VRAVESSLNFYSQWHNSTIPRHPLVPLTHPAQLQYSLPLLHICRLHIPPHEWREAHDRIPRIVRLAQEEPAQRAM